MTEHWIWLTRRRGLGAKGQKRLLEAFGSPEAVYAAGAEALARQGISPARAGTLLDKDLTAEGEILARCRDGGIRVLVRTDPDWPSRLLPVEDSPLLLYCKGTLPREDRPWIALVGTRAAGAEALTLARRLGWEIARCGGGVITGLAKGIDAAGARGALAGGGQVIGVLGCGPDLVYPRENAALFAQVEAQGCLISEYPPRTAPNARNFPVRNRLISALSDGVAVVRAAEQSGSLITAGWAADQGREVYAVPGDPADPLSRGCNALLRQGAQAAESGWDLLAPYVHRYPGVLRRVTEAPPPETQAAPAPKAPKAQAEPAPLPRDLNPVQTAILAALADGPLQADALIDRVGLPAAQVLPQLTLLQLRRLLAQTPGKYYERTNPDGVTRRS